MVGIVVVAGLRRWVALAQLVRAPGETAAAVGQFDPHVVNDAIRGVRREAAEVIQGPRFSDLTAMRLSESVGVVVLLVAQQAGILVLHAGHAKVAGESGPGSGLVAQLVS